MLSNTGIISSDNASTAAISVDSFINDGTVHVTNGDMFKLVSGVTTDTGLFSIGSHATLEFISSVSAHQTVAFAANNGNGLLTLASPNSFQGILADIQKTLATSASSSGTTLDVTLASSGVLSFTLGAPLTGLTMTSSDHHGGRLLTFS